MKEFDLLVILAVFQEMLGPLLWLLLAIIVLGTLAFVLLLIRERGVVSRRMVFSQTLSPLGGAFALILMAKVSSSGFTDAGGPVDWLLIALVFSLGLVGSGIILYTIGGWWSILRGNKPA
ncbi:MAG: DUF5368 domain-containing protein [Betaproteobacteria bacterium]|nr:DUF5368 domain-containing protein [Betaproteobacteria bacterium]MCL2886580.1 DUF5368 domain-containing protein [Betaproteobacteria bacterium]